MSDIPKIPQRKPAVFTLENDQESAARKPDPVKRSPTSFGTNFDVSPPKIEISRTIVAEINMYLSDGVRNMVSTPGFNLRFIPAI